MKFKPRSVKVDIGHGLQEDWCKAKVIKSRMVRRVLDKVMEQRLLVELPDGTRIWVSYWAEILKGFGGRALSCANKRTNACDRGIEI